MNSEKVEKIKKGLECCSTICSTIIDNNVKSEEQDNSCQECPYRISYLCSWELDSDALTLINELESENKKLQRDCVITAYDKLRAENKKLKERLGELEEKIIDETLVEFNKPFYSNQFNAWCIYLKDGDYITSLCLTKEQAEARLLELKKGITK